MSNKMFVKGLSTFLLLSTGLTFAKESADSVAYTQNNLPRQNQAAGALGKDMPIIINADLLYGRVISDQAYYGIRSSSNSNPAIKESFNWPNRSQFGYRVGLGVGLGNNVANLSIQYTWLRSKHHETLQPTSDAPFITLQSTDAGFPTTNITNSKINARGSLRYQTLDLVTQAATWMLGSKTRFQPIGGVRYMYFRRFLKSQLIVNDVEQNFYNQTAKIHATGPFIGTDIKFIIYPSLHFFSNWMIGVLSGPSRIKSQVFVNSTPANTLSSGSKAELTFDPFWEVRFGLAWSCMFQNNWLLSLRLAYELMSFTHSDAPVVVMSDPNLTVVKTQAALFGFTLAY